MKRTNCQQVKSLCCVHSTGLHDKSTTMLSTLDGPARQVNHYAKYTGRASTTSQEQCFVLDGPARQALCCVHWTCRHDED